MQKRYKNARRLTRPRPGFTCLFFPPLDILRSLKPKSTWRSTVDVKKWPSQWWMQLFRHCWAWIKGLVAELVCSGIVNSFLILLTSLFVHFYAIWRCSKLANMRFDIYIYICIYICIYIYMYYVCIYIYILVQVLVENDYPSGNLILQSKNKQFTEAVEMSPFLSDCHRFRCWLCWLYWLYLWWVRQHRPEATGSYASKKVTNRGWPWFTFALANDRWQLNSFLILLTSLPLGHCWACAFLHAIFLWL